MSDFDTFPARPAPMPVPVIQLPPPPDAVSKGVSAFRVACAQWAPHPGASDHKTELQACDVVLNRDIQFPLGVSIGVIGTLAFVWFVSASRSLIRARAFSPADNQAFHGVLGLLGIGGGYVASWPLTWQFGGVWSDTKCELAVAGCITGMVGLLAVLRWQKQRVTT